MVVAIKRSMLYSQIDMQNDDRTTTSLPDDVDTDVNDHTSPAVQDEQSMSGSSPATTSDDDVAQALGDVTGEEPKRGKAYSIADEMDKDELRRRGLNPKDYGID